MEVQVQEARGRPGIARTCIVTTYLRDEVIGQVVRLHVKRNINTDDLRDV